MIAIPFAHPISRMWPSLTPATLEIRIHNDKAQRPHERPRGPLPQSRCALLPAPTEPFALYSSPLLSSSPSSGLAAAFLAFFFFFLFLFLPAFFESGCSRILRISSSSIFLSVLNLLRSQAGGPPIRVMPFLVMAVADS